MYANRKVMACAMINKGYNVKSLSEATGLKTVTISRLKNGKSVSESSFMKIAKALELRASELYIDPLEDE